jgi:uncharacterized protein (UPF0332 family)
MDARGFCVLAGLLAAQGKPASCRSAVSRAYYSLFHVIHQFMMLKGVPLPRKQTDCHEVVYRLLFNAGDEDLKVIASELNDLRGRRNEADYDLNQSEIEDRKTAMALVDAARSATESFDQYCQDTARIQRAVEKAIEYAATTRVR